MFTKKKELRCQKNVLRLTESPTFTKNSTVFSQVNFTITKKILAGGKKT